MTTETNPEDRVLYLAVSLGKPGIKRRVDKAKVEVDAEERMITVSKDIIDSDLYRAVANFDKTIRRWIYLKSLPVPGLKKGVYAVPAVLVEGVEEQIEKYKERRDALVDEFVEEYPAKVEQARDLLRSNFNAENYPSEIEIAESFRFSHRYLSFGVPEGLKGISGNLFKAEAEKAQAAWEETLEEWRGILRAAFAELIDHAVDKLTTETKGGKPQKVRDSVIGNLDEFFSTFDARNVADDEELKALVGKARKLVKGVSSDILKDDAAARAKVTSGFEAIKATITESLVDKPARRIRFAEDGAS